MTDARIPRPLPMPMILAMLLPSLVLAVLEVLRELEAPLLRVDWQVLLLLWILTTVPIILIVVGARRLRSEPLPRDEAHPDVKAALEAVARAERLVDETSKALAEMKEDLARRSRGGAEPPPGPFRGRSGGLSLGLALGFLLVAGLVALAFSSLPADSPPVHIHPSFAVFVDGERVEYTDETFDLSERRFLRGHLHTPNQDIMHIEGRQGLTLGEFFEQSLLADLTEAALRIDNVVHDGATYSNNGTHTLQLWVAASGGEDWRRVMTLPGYVPEEHDRILVTFTDGTPGELEREQAIVSTDFP